MSEAEEFEFRLRFERESAKPAAEPFPVKLGRGALDAGAGALRGAGSIGATLLAPVDAAARAMGVENDYIGRTDRREAMTGALRELGADTDSVAFGGGKLAGEIAGTAGAGPALGVGAKALGAPGVASALASSGFQGGNLALRSGAGAAAGATQAAMVDPSSAGPGAALGGVLPGGVKVAGAAGSYVGGKAADAMNWGAERLMQSALKPTIEQLRSGEAAIAVRTLLDHGINATGAGVNKIKTLIGDLNTKIGDEIANSTATVDPGKVARTLGDTRSKFGNQVSPSGDLASIQRVEDDFTSTIGAGQIPVQLAQKVKQGTYKVLKGKYGEVGSAETEAQKALARGLKEEIATAVPGVGPLNAEESRLLATLAVAERRALMDMSKNPIGLSALAGNPIGFAAFMADRSAAFKSLAARLVNRSIPQSNPLQMLSNSAPGQLGYRSAPVLTADE